MIKDIKNLAKKYENFSDEKFTSSCPGALMLELSIDEQERVVRDIQTLSRFVRDAASILDVTNLLMNNFFLAQEGCDMPCPAKMELGDGSYLISEDRGATWKKLDQP